MSRFYSNFVGVCKGVCRSVSGCVEGISRVYWDISWFFELLTYDVYFYLL